MKLVRIWVYEQKVVFSTFVVGFCRKAQVHSTCLASFYAELTSKRKLCKKRCTYVVISLVKVPVYCENELIYSFPKKLSKRFNIIRFPHYSSINILINPSFVIFLKGYCKVSLKFLIFFKICVLLLLNKYNCTSCS